MYQAAHTQKAQIKCIDIIVGDMSDDLKNKVKGKIPDDPTKTMGLYNSVSIAVGAIYDLKTNVSVTDDDDDKWCRVCYRENRRQS